MSNSITLAKNYVPLLDEVYKVEARSSILDAPADLVRQGLNANEILLPKIALQGLADYSRANGYVAGDVTFEWQTHAFTQDRGRAFLVDAQDDLETVEVAFGAVAGQFIRVHVAPEVDAYRFSTLATKAIVALNTDEWDGESTGAISHFNDAISKLEDKEVNTENLVAFISPSYKKEIKDSIFVLQRTENGIVTNVQTIDGIELITVPQPRFYTEIDLLDGAGEGEVGGGFAKADSASDIALLLVDRTAVLGITKTALPRIFSPEENQSANAWKFDYRLYHDIFVPDNKVDGIWVTTVAEGE